MCSTPRPRRNVKGKTNRHVASILASMNSDARQRFAERANLAIERRMAQQNQTSIAIKNIRKSHSSDNNKAKRQHDSWLYWLLTANIADIFLSALGLRKPNS